MSRYIVVIISLLLFWGCSTKEPVQIGKKSFENEDLLIMQALHLQHQKQYQDAIDTYKQLFQKSKKLNYLIEAAKLSFVATNSPQTLQLLELGLKQDSNNVDLRRLLVGYYMKVSRFQEATQEVEKLLKIEKNARNLAIAGNIYLQQNNYPLALKYFQSSYNKAKDENTLLNMADILYNFLDKQDEAISYLETHVRLQGCDEKVCFKLIEVYGKQKDINGIITTYKKLYEENQNDVYAKKIIELYMYKKDTKSAIEFLKKTGYNQEMLVNIYASLGEFQAAFDAAEKLFEEKNDFVYLGYMGIYEYELNKNNLSETVLASIASKFDRALQKINNAVFLNYYGYLLIDHERDIAKGIALVKEALLQEPNSLFYLDSLAWGLFKQNKCIEAQKILEPFMKNIQEEEVQMHYQKIQECLGKK
ncbi:MAG: hypothetical protein IBX44_06765 [Sulfurospirillum sp.]|nr:hypothetical protein [Sulfurospirillum sp.]